MAKAGAKMGHHGDSWFFEHGCRPRGKARIKGGASCNHELDEERWDASDEERRTSTVPANPLPVDPTCNPNRKGGKRATGEKRSLSDGPDQGRGGCGDGIDLKLPFEISHMLEKGKPIPNIRIPREREGRGWRRGPRRGVVVRNSQLTF